MSVSRSKSLHCSPTKWHQNEPGGEKAPLASGLLLMNNPWDRFSWSVLARPLIWISGSCRATGEKRFGPLATKLGLYLVTPASAESNKLFVASRLWFDAVMRVHPSSRSPAGSLRWAFLVGYIGRCRTSPASSSQVDLSSPEPLNQGACVWMGPYSFGSRDEDCFSLSWGDDAQRGAHAEQNKDEGDNDCLV